MMLGRQLIATMVDNTSIKHSNLIQKLSKPLERFGIHYFCYQFVSNRGDWFTLGNNAEWLHYCAEKETHRCDPSLLSPDKIESGIFLPETHDNQLFHERLIKTAIDKYDIAQCMAIAKKDELGSSCYFFAGSKTNRKLMATYLNHLHILNQNFTSFVDTEITPIFDACLSHSVNLVELDNPIYLTGEDKFFQQSSLQMPELMQNPKIMPKVRSGIPYRLGSNLICFTPREADCLNLLLDGYTTSKEIARQLNLSYRTIEEYITNIRNKVNCRKTLDLIKLICIMLNP